MYVRVRHRVDVEHGHFVDERTIEHKFYKGLSSLDKLFLLADRTFILNTEQKFRVDSLMSFENGKLLELVDSLPQSIKKYVPDLNELLEKR